MRIENKDIRHFYEIEAERQQWSVRQLQHLQGVIPLETFDTCGVLQCLMDKVPDKTTFLLYGNKTLENELVANIAKQCLNLVRGLFLLETNTTFLWQIRIIIGSTCRIFNLKNNLIKV